MDWKQVAFGLIHRHYPPHKWNETLDAVAKDLKGWLNDEELATFKAEFIERAKHSNQKWG